MPQTIDDLTVSRAEVEAVLNRIRPAIEDESGSIALIAVEGKNARVVMEGHFLGCPTSVMTLRFGIERAIRETIPGFASLIIEEAEGGVTPSFE